jgi:hypothetical protein
MSDWSARRHAPGLRCPAAARARVIAHRTPRRADGEQRHLVDVGSFSRIRGPDEGCSVRIPELDGAKRHGNCPPGRFQYTGVAQTSLYAFIVVTDPRGHM